MRILVVWDNDAEADLIGMYLGVDGSEITLAVGADGLNPILAQNLEFDLALLAINLPTVEMGYEVFQRLRNDLSEIPVIGACMPQEVVRVVRFMTNGMSAYVIRDTAGDYLFMLQAMAEQTVDAVRAAREQKLAQKLREEVESVRKLQASVIPKNIDAPPGYSVHGRYEPSQIRVLGGQPVTMAGGDYYDIFMLPDNNMVLLVGDASGHGMKAAMSIMTMHTLVRMIRSQSYRDTAHFVTEINRQLCEQSIVSEEGGFITLLYAILNPETGELRWTSAGHPPPLLQNMDTGEVMPLAGKDCGGLPLAITEYAEYETYVSALPPHVRLVLFTDGLEEAFPEGTKQSHSQYGIDGISETLRNYATEPASDALTALFDDSNAFTQGAGRHDDTSVVLLERRVSVLANGSARDGFASGRCETADFPRRFENGIV